MPPIPAKLLSKILSGQFLAMKELLGDNIVLHHQRLYLGSASPRLWEIDMPGCPASWCMLPSEQLMLKHETYGHLVMQEAEQHVGPCWLEYVSLFRQHAAPSPSTTWQFNPSLNAATVLSYLGQCAPYVMSQITCQTPVSCRCFNLNPVNEQLSCNHPQAKANSGCLRWPQMPLPASPCLARDL